MGLDGLRAWIGEVERKLGVRTKVMLALAVIAIAIAGAGIYLAIDTRNKAVSEGDVQTLQKISGHVDINVLVSTYYRETAAQVAARL